MVTALIDGLLKTGAPWGLLCAALTMAVVALWKDRQQLTDKLYQLAQAQASAAAETRKTLEAVERDVHEITREMRVQVPDDNRRAG